jgi:phosphotransferase system enzyme I (PtsI)
VHRKANGPDREAKALREGIARSASELRALAASADQEAAPLLEFQQAMLEDDALSGSAFEAIEGGASAEAAWTDALDEQIAQYRAAEDAYFAARAADLQDIRDRVLRVLTGSPANETPPGAILGGDDITPSQFLAADWSRGGGIVLRQGSAASHVAMLARARGVPMLVGVRDLPMMAANTVLVDADEGAIVLGPDDATVLQFRTRRAAGAAVELEAAGLAYRPAHSADGTPVAVHINIAGPDDLASLDPAICDGVGLMRTEFLYAHGLPDEETQFAAYRKVACWAGDKPVVIRTVDAGGDKPVPGFTSDETNPFLGQRGIRLALAKPGIFRAQIRALLRAAAEGNVHVMLPMVTLASELAGAADLFADEARQLAAASIPHRMPRLGIMVEVPAVAVAPQLFDHAAFFSIGSNDLTQYVMAASRDNSAVAALHDAAHPAVISLIESVVRFANGRQIPVSLCGDAGADPNVIPHLLRAGLRSLSVAPAQLARVKQAIAAVRLEKVP